MGEVTAQVKGLKEQARQINHELQVQNQALDETNERMANVTSQVCRFFYRDGCMGSFFNHALHAASLK